MQMTRKLYTCIVYEDRKHRIQNEINDHKGLYTHLETFLKQNDIYMYFTVESGYEVHVPVGTIVKIYALDSNMR